MLHSIPGELVFEKREPLTVKGKGTVITTIITTTTISITPSPYCFLL
jgi:hypothetical protein